MAKELTLNAELRTQLHVGLRLMRRQGAMPAVVYGHEVDSTPLTLEQAAFSRLWRSAGMGHMVQLSVSGESKPRRVLVREVQVNPRNGRLLHVDFYQVNPKEKIHTEVAVVLEGEPPMVTLHEAQLVRGLDHLRIECLPDDLPDAFVVDVSVLKEVTDAIRVSDLPVPSGVTILNEPDTLIATITTRLGAKEEPEEAPAEEVAAEGVEGAPAEGGAAPTAEAGEGSKES